MANGIIDFRGERGRHERLLGREDVMAELDALLLEGEPTRGWVLVKGGPGMGKSALLAHWLARREAAGHRVPHHFLRRQVEEWDRPEVVLQNLVAQLEALFPVRLEPRAGAGNRLRELLQRISESVLVPRSGRLILLVDGLDEVEADATGQNPLPRFLPHVLPPGVKVLCASRPTYPHLNWLEAREGLRTLDLDGARWAASNEEAVRRYWARMDSRFEPSLGAAFLSEAVQQAGGNMLHALKLGEWLLDQPADRRRAELLPRGLEAILDDFWQRLQSLPEESREVVLEGLGLVSIAREALPLSVLATVAGWTDRGAREQFLRVARPFLLEEPGAGEPAWRPFHESLGAFILGKLGLENIRQEHRRLAAHLCVWPVEKASNDFRRRYVLRHGVTHWLEAGDWVRARALCTDAGYLGEKCRECDVAAVEGDLLRAVSAAPARDCIFLGALHHAVQAESHWLRKDPEALWQLVYNRLRCSGWAAEQVEKDWPLVEGLPVLRLRHPVWMGGGELRTLLGHRNMVLGCAVAADGRRALSASADGTLRVWDLGTGRELAVLEGHQAGVNGCAMTPEGRRALSASGDGTLRLWDLETGRTLAVLKGHRGGVLGCAMTPEGRRALSASEDGTLRWWDLETGRMLAMLGGHRGEVTGCAVTRDGRRAVSTSFDGTLRVWNLETLLELAVLGGEGGVLNGCAVTPDGRRALSASRYGVLTVWDLEELRPLVALEGHEESVSGCAMLEDGRRAVSSSFDGTLKLWDVEQGRVLATLQGHGGAVMGCAVTGEGRRVVSASSDRTLKVWEPATGQESLWTVMHQGEVTGCAVTRDGTRLLSASRDGRLKLWDVESGQELASLRGHGSWLNDCAFLKEGRQALSASEDGTLKLWDLETGRELEGLDGHREGVVRCAVSADGHWMLSASRDRTLGVWDLRAGRKEATLAGHRGGVVGVAIMANGRRALSASEDGTLKLWEVRGARELVTLAGHAGGVTCCAMQASGLRALSGSEDRTLKLWDLEKRQALLTLTGHEGAVVACAFTPGGHRAVSVSVDRTLKLWELESGRCLRTLHGVCGFVSVAVADDLICAGDALGNIWILEEEAPESSGSLPVHRLRLLTGQ